MNILQVLADVTVKTPKSPLDTLFNWLTDNAKMVGLVLACLIIAGFAVKLWSALPKWVLVGLLLIIGISYGMITLHLKK